MSEDVMAVVHRVLSENTTDRVAACGIRSVVIGHDVLPTVADTVSSLLGARPERDARARVLFIVDETPIMRLGVSVKPAVELQLATRFDVTRLVLDDGHAELHASEDVVARAAAAAEGFDAVVTLGGGTISDIGKMASARVGNPPLVIVQTAASVDGYTDDVSVLLKNGVKRTVPSRWPDVVIADTALIAEAPARMNRAGFGEINSMFVAPADWLLAKKLGFDDLFSHGPVALLQEVGSGIEEWSPGLATADFDATASLVRALAIRGIATGVAGSTALLSGVEHLVSHMLDIARGSRGQRIGLHGAQVGVASVIAALVWEELFEKLDIAHAQLLMPIDLDTDNLRDSVFDAFRNLDPTEELALECWRDYSAKLALWLNRSYTVQSLVRYWPKHRQELRDLVKSPAEIASGLRAAGSPVTFAELDPQIDDALAFWAVRNCAMMRNRLTALDLLIFFGWWDDAAAQRIIQRANALAADAIGAVA